MPLAKPAELELKNIRALLARSTPDGNFSGLQVLEIGTGNGRLAWPFAAEAARWVGLDVDETEVSKVAHDPRKKALPALNLLVGDACALSFADETFDVAFFTWSLCCFLPEVMAQALAEVGRVLRPEGTLLDLHATEDPVFLEVWHTGHSGNGQPENLEAIHRVKLGCLDPDGSPHGFAEATDALVEALETTFTLRYSTAFEYRYFFDTVGSLTRHLKDNHEHATASKALLAQARAALKQAPAQSKLVAIQRVAATAMQKL